MATDAVFASERSQEFGGGELQVTNLLANIWCAARQRTSSISSARPHGCTSIEASRCAKNSIYIDELVFFLDSQAMDTEPRIEIESWVTQFPITTDTKKLDTETDTRTNRTETWTSRTWEKTI